ncbi:glycosyltransferase family 2 protein [Aeromonas veronii]
MNVNNSVAALVVTFNPDSSDLVCLINSLSTQVGSIIIIDNNSKNISDWQTLTENKQVVLIPLRENVGIAEAQNRGIIRAAEIMKISHCIIFDQDSSVPHNFVEKLVAADKILKIHNKVASVGPICKDEESGNYYPISKMKGFRLKNIYPDKGHEYIEASFLISSGSLISLDVFKKVGLMNGSFFIDNVDLEWGFRACSNGFKHFAVCDVIMKHKIGNKNKKLLGKSYFIHSEFRQYYKVRNSLWMLKIKEVPLGYKIRYLALLPVKLILGVFIADKKLEHVKQTLKGLKDGALLRVGGINYL